MRLLRSRMKKTLPRCIDRCDERAEFKSRPVTAARLNLDVTIFVWEDCAYGLIAWKQQSQFGKHTDLSFTNPDFVKLAEAFGWNGYRCENSRDLEKTLEASYNDDGPSLVVIPIDYRENTLLSKRLGEIACPI